MERDDEAKRRLRMRNWAVFLALAAWAIIVYLVSIVRLRGH